MRCLIYPSPLPALSSASTTLMPPSMLPTTICRRRVTRPAPSFRQQKLRRRRSNETVALRPRCPVVRAQMNHDHDGKVEQQFRPNHFIEEFQTITGRAYKLYFIPYHRRKLQLQSDEILNSVPDICRLTGDCVIMASQLVDSGKLTTNGMSTKICANTVQRTLGAYVDVFLSISKECYKKKFDSGTTISGIAIRFIDALRGLGSISHILLEDALEALNHTDPKKGLLEYTFNNDVKSIHRDFNCKMDDLENDIWYPKTSNLFKLAFMTINEGVEVTQSFLGVMLARRQRTVEKSCGGRK